MLRASSGEFTKPRQQRSGKSLKKNNEQYNSGARALEFLADINLSRSLQDNNLK